MVFGPLVPMALVNTLTIITCLSHKCRLCLLVMNYAFVISWRNNALSLSLSILLCDKSIMWLSGSTFSGMEPYVGIVVKMLGHCRWKVCMIHQQGRCEPCALWIAAHARESVAQPKIKPMQGKVSKLAEFTADHIKWLLLYLSRTQLRGRGRLCFSTEANNDSRIRLHNTFERQIALILLTRAPVRLSIDFVSRFIISFHTAPG